MHIPKGKPIHESLKTSYLNSTALLADLQVSGFTGYLQLASTNANGYILLKEGKIINAYDESAEWTRLGNKAVDSILLRASAPHGTVSVYAHSSAVVTAISGRIDGEVRYFQLETDFADLTKLIKKLVTLPENYFYIEIQWSQLADGIIYRVQPEASTEALLSFPSGEVLTGEEAQQRINAMLMEQVAQFSVYRCADPRAINTNLISFPDNRKALDSPVISSVVLPETSAEVELTTTTLTTEVAALLTADAIDPIVDSVSESVPLSSDLADLPVVAIAEPTAVVASLPEPSAAELSEEDARFQEKFTQLLQLLGELVETVEKSSLTVIKEGNFTIALRAGLLQVTPQYPFFDPFTEEFQYQAGKITFVAAAAPIDLVEGLAQALRCTLLELTRSVARTALRQAVEEGLRQLLHQRQAEFDHFGVTDILSEIADI
jgi:hypothetical protein